MPSLDPGLKQFCKKGLQSHSKEWNEQETCYGHACKDSKVWESEDWSSESGGHEWGLGKIIGNALRTCLEPPFCRVRGKARDVVCVTHTSIMDLFTIILPYSWPIHMTNHSLVLRWVLPHCLLTCISNILGVLGTQLPLLILATLHLLMLPSLPSLSLPLLTTCLLILAQTQNIYKSPFSPVYKYWTCGLCWTSSSAFSLVGRSLAVTELLTQPKLDELNLVSLTSTAYLLQKCLLHMPGLTFDFFTCTHVILTWMSWTLNWSLTHHAPPYSPTLTHWALIILFADYVNSQ